MLTLTFVSMISAASEFLVSGTVVDPAGKPMPSVHLLVQVARQPSLDHDSMGNVELKIGTKPK